MASKILTFVDASVRIREAYQADLSSLCISLVHLLRRFKPLPRSRRNPFLEVVGMTPPLIAHLKPRLSDKLPACRENPNREL
jgi:hypothetical protein